MGAPCRRRRDMHTPLAWSRGGVAPGCACHGACATTRGAGSACLSPGVRCRPNLGDESLPASPSVPPQSRQQQQHKCAVTIFSYETMGRGRWKANKASRAEGESLRTHVGNRHLTRATTCDRHLSSLAPLREDCSCGWVQSQRSALRAIGFCSNAAAWCRSWSPLACTRDTVIALAATPPGVTL